VKFSSLAGSILAGLILCLAGCDNSETKTSEAKPEIPVVNPGPAAPVAPVEPSPIPSLPPTGKVDEKATAAKPAETTPPETKPEEKKAEPKLEAPK
jgi:hypothetical protein